MLKFDKSGEELNEFLLNYGSVPLPPYIKKSAADPERYQTVYANEAGSAAAPTAGLHFTREYLEKLACSGVNTAYLTLHIGPGTFAPVKTENIQDHRMHSEFYRVSAAAAELVNKTRCERQATIKTAGEERTVGARINYESFANARDRQNCGRIVCVGTTSLRVLESVADGSGLIKPGEGQTDIFIYPGYEFKCADALLTNFHLPGSTLLMLICAFAGYGLAMEAYRLAVENEYRFYSFGDAMLII